MTRNAVKRTLPRRLLTSLTIGAAVVLAAPVAAEAATRYVDDTGGVNAPGCTVQAAPCLTVQYAVDQAIAGDTIDLAAGTYTPGALVDKADLTISGAGKAATIVNGTTALPRAFDLRGNADRLTIQNMKMLGPYTGAGTITDRSGINVPATAGLDVADLTLRNLDLTGLKYAIDVRYPGSATGWTIDGVDSHINEYGSRWQGPTTAMTISNSHFDFNNFGLYVGHTNLTPRAPGVFQNVEIADSSFDGNATKGLYFEHGADLDFHGLSVVTPPPPSPRADVNPNNGIDVNVKYGPYSNVRIADSVFSGATEAGVLIHGRNDGASYSPIPAILDNVDLERLTVTGNSATPVNSAGGINFQTATTNISVKSSRIVGNGSGGIVSSVDPGPASTVDATDNWWGCNEGPTTDGSNACSTLVQYPGLGVIDADPWLVLSASAAPEEIAIGGATSAIAASLDSNSDGAPAALSPPDGPTVGFATNLGSVTPAGDQLANGKAVTLLTSGPTAGTAQVTASLDFATAIAAVEFVAPPANTVPPVVSGNPNAGSELSCSLGDWTGNGLTHARQWLRDGADIAAETGATYTSASADVGHAIGCRVTATNTVGASVSETGNSITVLPAPTPEPATTEVAAASVVEPVPNSRVKAGRPTEIATVTCMSATGCELSLPGTIRIRIDKHVFKTRVSGPTTVAPGATEGIGIYLSRHARRALQAHNNEKVKIRVTVGVTAGGTTVATIVRAKIRPKK